MSTLAARTTDTFTSLGRACVHFWTMFIHHIMGHSVLLTDVSAQKNLLRLDLSSDIQEVRIEPIREWFP